MGKKTKVLISVFSGICGVAVGKKIYVFFREKRRTKEKEEELRFLKVQKQFEEARSEGEKFDKGFRSLLNRANLITDQIERLQGTDI